MTKWKSISINRTGHSSRTPHLVNAMLGSLMHLMTMKVDTQPHEIAMGRISLTHYRTSDSLAVSTMSVFTRLSISSALAASSKNIRTVSLV